MKEINNFNIERTLIDKMHDQALESIGRNRIKEKDFSDVYGDTESDIAEAKTRLEKWDRKSSGREKEMKKYADVLEAIIAEYIGKGWLGNGVKALNTADTDDLNGVDIVSEFTKEDPRQYLGLGIDATFAKDLRGKFRGIKGSIVRGQLARVKYYRTDDGQVGLSNVPNVVVGVELATIKELGKAWIEGDEEFIENHYIQFQILDQILLQLDKFSEYADTIGRKEIADKFKAVHGLIARIKKDKIRTGRHSGRGQRDLMHSRLDKELGKFLNDAEDTTKQRLSGYSINDLSEKFNMNK